MKILHENFHKKSFWTFWISNFEIFWCKISKLGDFFYNFEDLEKITGGSPNFDGNLSQKRFMAFIGVLQECSQKRFGPSGRIFGSSAILPKSEILTSVEIFAYRR